MSLHPAPRERHESELSLAQLRGDSARMVPHWVTPAPPVPAPVSPR